MAAAEEVRARVEQMRDDVMFLLTAGLEGENDLVAARVMEIAAHPTRSSRVLFALVVVVRDSTLEHVTDEQIAEALDRLRADFDAQVERVTARGGDQ